LAAINSQQAPSTAAVIVTEAAAAGRFIPDPFVAWRRLVVVIERRPEGGCGYDGKKRRARGALRFAAAAAAAGGETVRDALGFRFRWRVCTRAKSPGRVSEKTMGSTLPKRRCN
jgi:hypothetical protein